MYFEILPWLLLPPNQGHEHLNLRFFNVFLQQLPVVVQQTSDGVFSEDVVAYLALHELKLGCNIFLHNSEREGEGINET